MTSFISYLIYLSIRRVDKYFLPLLKDVWVIQSSASDDAYLHSNDIIFAGAFGIEECTFTDMSKNQCGYGYKLKWVELVLGRGHARAASALSIT